MPPFISGGCALHTEMHTNRQFLRQHAGRIGAQIFKAESHTYLNVNECPDNHKIKAELNRTLITPPRHMKELLKD